MEKYNTQIMSMLGLNASVFGLSLLDIASQRDDIIVICADQSIPAGLEKFKTQFPEKFINVGIAEQNMIGVAAGLSDEGFVPICVAQACFLSMRSFEPIRQFAGYMNKPIVFVGLFSGFSTNYMGNTHYAIEDIALMRAIPNMTICSPADPIEAVKCFESVINLNKPAYIRLWGSTNAPIVYTDNYDFIINSPTFLRHGNDIQIIATGSMVIQAIKAAELLKNRYNIEASILNFHTIKPINTTMLSNDIPIFTVEEHSVIGGLGDAILSKGYNVTKIGVDDKYSRVGDYNFLLNENNLSSDQIAELIYLRLNK